MYGTVLGLDNFFRPAHGQKVLPGNTYRIVEHVRYCTRDRLFLFRHAAGKKALQGNVVEHIRYPIGLDYICLSMPLGRKCCKVILESMYGTVPGLDYFCLGMPQGRKCYKVVPLRLFIPALQ